MRGVAESVEHLFFGWETIRNLLREKQKGTS